MDPTLNFRLSTLQLIDTHVHFDDLAQARSLMAEAAKAGVRKIVAAASGIDSSITAVEIARALPDIKAMAGIHPHEAQKDYDRFTELENLAKTDAVTAIGECGLDYHYMHSPKEVQIEVFQKQIMLAQSLDKPLVVHSREAMDETLAALKKNGIPEAGCVLHCFSGGTNDAKDALDIGCYLSFGGIITFKKAAAAQVASEVPLGRILLETDSPYLSPEPLRGKKNSPANLHLIAKKLAELKDISIEEVARVTTENAKRLFGFS